MTTTVTSLQTLTKEERNSEVLPISEVRKISISKVNDLMISKSAKIEMFKKTVEYNFTQITKAKEAEKSGKACEIGATIAVFVFYIGLVLLAVGIGSFIPICGIKGIHLCASIPLIVVGVVGTSILPFLKIGSISLFFFALLNAIIDSFN